MWPLGIWGNRVARWISSFNNDINRFSGTVYVQVSIPRHHATVQSQTSLRWVGQQQQALQIWRISLLLQWRQPLGYKRSCTGTRSTSSFFKHIYVNYLKTRGQRFVTFGCECQVRLTSLVLQLWRVTLILLHVYILIGKLWNIPGTEHVSVCTGNR